MGDRPPRILALLLAGCMILAKAFTLSVLKCSHLQKEDDSKVFFIGLQMHVKCF